MKIKARITYHERMLEMAKTVRQPSLITYHESKLTMWKKVYALRREFNVARLKRDLKMSIEREAS